MLFLVFHTVAIFIYAFPKEHMPTGLRNFVKPYVHPLFSQRWAMFAPCPLIDGEITLKLTDNNGQEWVVEPFKKIIANHRLWRVTHHGDLSIQGANLIHWVSTDVIDWSTEDLRLKDLAYMKLNETLSYNLLRRMAYGWAYQNKFSLRKAEVECLLKNVKNDMQQKIVYPEMKWNVE